MDFYCDCCEYHVRFGRGMAPAPSPSPPCPACGIGLLHAGKHDSGFWIKDGALEAFGKEAVAPCNPSVGPGSKPFSQLDFFCNERGDKYKAFIQAETVYLGEFNKYLIPKNAQFAWLSPYIGNKHNQRYFTQAALAKVAIAQFTANGGVFPRLIEPFVGSGQVFLNACCCGPAFNQGFPLFHEIIGGDLNPYVVAAYELFRDQGTKFVDQYKVWSAKWDANVGASFRERLDWLEATGCDQAMGTVLYGKTFAVMSYIYVVNRCVFGCKITGKMGVQGTMRGKLTIAKLAEIRERESRRLTNVCQTVSTLGATTFACQDFAQTCKLAKPTDIVFMDCPFPTFNSTVPKADATNPEAQSVAAHTYGVGDDGAELQKRIVNVARDLVDQGTTVVLCNYANPG